jgi:hypothetical protein
MTQDEIIEMAKQAKLDREPPDEYCRVEYWTATEDELIAFAKLVAAKAAVNEREDCADLLEHGYKDDEGHHLQYAKELREWGQA